MVKELIDNFKSDVLEVPESVYTTMANQIATDIDNPKYAIAYIYNDEQGPDFDFRALSMDEDLKKKFVFFAVQNPSKNLKSNSIPGIVGVFID